jgi:hypothetical protein
MDSAVLDLQEVEKGVTTMPNENETSLTPEERNMPVTFGDLEIALKAVITELSKREDALQEIEQELLNKTINTVADRINKERYERLRFEYFIIELICRLNHLYKKDILDAYREYCEKFDKLNKEQKVGDDNAVYR